MNRRRPRLAESTRIAPLVCRGAASGLLVGALADHRPRQPGGLIRVQHAIDAGRLERLQRLLDIFLRCHLRQPADEAGQAGAEQEQDDDDEAHEWLDRLPAVRVQVRVEPAGDHVHAELSDGRVDRHDDERLPLHEPLEGAGGEAHEEGREHHTHAGLEPGHGADRRGQGLVQAEASLDLDVDGHDGLPERVEALLPGLVGPPDRLRHPLDGPHDPAEDRADEGADGGHPAEVARQDAVDAPVGARCLAVVGLADVLEDVLDHDLQEVEAAEHLDEVEADQQGAKQRERCLHRQREPETHPGQRMPLVLHAQALEQVDDPGGQEVGPGHGGVLGQLERAMRQQPAVVDRDQNQKPEERPEAQTTEVCDGDTMREIVADDLLRKQPGRQGGE